jgi:hypothetical protein
VVRNITRDNGTSRHHRPTANHETRQNDRSRADAAPLPKHHFGIIQGILLAAWPQVIGKYGAGSDKDIVFHGNSIPKANPTLESHPVANGYLSFDKGMIANIAVLAHNCTPDYMCEGPHPSPPPHNNTLINARQGMGKRGLIHNVSAWPEPASLQVANPLGRS